MKRNKLTLCLLAKNEAEHLPRCLSSVRDLADEIILVDTGSCDDTKEIARSFGAKILEESWKNDFSAHRNSALAAAGGDWILSLDCDEELAPPFFETCRQGS